MEIRYSVATWRICRSHFPRGMEALLTEPYTVCPIVGAVGRSDLHEAY